MKEKNIMEVPPDFNWKMYLELNPDICRFPNYSTQQGSISHWKQYGRKEGRPYKRSIVERPIEVSKDPIVNYEYTPLTEKIVVYTCISGNYEKLKEIKGLESNIDYICFTDNKKLRSNTWKIREIPRYLIGLDNTRMSRCLKILPHLFLSEYDISLWVDGNIQINGNLNEFISSHIKISNLMTTKHPDRICVYDESVAVIKQEKDDENIVNSQMSYYKNQLYPNDFGMVQTNIMLRKHNEKEIIEISKQWWDEVLKRSKRDQLSFNYVCWKNQDVNAEIINPSITLSKYFSTYFHNGTLNPLKGNYGSLINYFNGKEV